MEVQSDVQQPDPCPLDSPRSGTGQQNEAKDRQSVTSDRTSTENQSKDAHSATQKDDKKVRLWLPHQCISAGTVLCLSVYIHVCVEWLLPVCPLHSHWLIQHVIFQSDKRQSCNESCLFFGFKWCQAFCIESYQVLEGPICTLLTRKVKLLL